MALLILQPFRHFTYVTAHSPTLPSLYLHHSSFSNPSVASPTSQLILQPFFCFSYVTCSSLTSPGKPPMGHARVLFLRLPVHNISINLTSLSIQLAVSSILVNELYAYYCVKSCHLTTIINKWIKNVKNNFYVILSTVVA